MKIELFFYFILFKKKIKSFTLLTKFVVSSYLENLVVDNDLTHWYHFLFKQFELNFNCLIILRIYIYIYIHNVGSFLKRLGQGLNSLDSRCHQPNHYCSSLGLASRFGLSQFIPILVAHLSLKYFLKKYKVKLFF